MKLTIFKMCTGLALSVLLSTTQAVAQDVPSAKDAAKSLYKTNKRATIVRILVPDLVPAAYQAALQNAAKIQRYFEAMAASPTEGLLGGSAVHAINHHSIASAHAAAIAGCNAKKKKASKPCVVVADFIPKAYKGADHFSLSANATEAFAKKYKRAKKSKAFAISPSTGSWGEAIKATSPAAARAAALADCKGKPASKGGDDCVIVSAD